MAGDQRPARCRADPAKPGTAPPLPQHNGDVRRYWASAVGALLIAGTLNSGCGEPEAVKEPVGPAEVQLSVSGSYSADSGPSAAPIEATASVSYEVNEAGVAEARAIPLPWSTKVKGPIMTVELTANAKEAKDARIECSIKSGDTVLASNVSTGSGSKVACRWKAK
jgi:hypothetical protein